jgi:hypothetical protein
LELIAHTCFIIISGLNDEWAMWWCSWLGQYGTSQKVSGSILNEFTGFFNLPNPSSLTMALGSTQPLTEMSTRNRPGGGGGKRQLGHKVDNCLENVGALTSHNPTGPHGQLQG